MPANNYRISFSVVLVLKYANRVSPSSPRCHLYFPVTKGLADKDKMSIYVSRKHWVSKELTWCFQTKLVLWGSPRHFHTCTRVYKTDRKLQWGFWKGEWVWRKQWLSVCRTEIEKGALMSSGESVGDAKARSRVKGWPGKWTALGREDFIEVQGIQKATHFKNIFLLLCCCQILNVIKSLPKSRQISWSFTA